MPRLTKDQQIENVLVAHAMMTDLPDHAVELGAWQNHTMRGSVGHACGSVGCLGGWVAVHPHFKKYGVYPNTEGAPRTKRNLDPFQLGWQLFGGFGLFMPNFSEIPDRQEALSRLERALDVLLA